MNAPSTWAWFVTNLKIGALSFGGSGRILLYQDDVVDRHKWLTRDEFMEILTLSQVLPGPNLVNLAAYLGYRLCGLLGAIAGVVALTLPGALFVIALLRWVDLRNPDVRLLFQGFSLASLMLFAAFVLQLARSLGNAPLRRAPLRVCVAMGTFALTLVPGLSLLHVILIGGVAGWAVERWGPRDLPGAAP